MTDAVFTVDGGLHVPTEHARGPWDPGQMHGGGPAALIAGALEALPTPAPMRVVRLAFTFEGPVPMEPVAVRAELTRTGRRLAFAEAAVSVDGRDALRARATLLRTADVALPPAAEEPGPPGPEDAEPARWAGVGQATGFHLSAMEIRFARGGWVEPGPAAAWFRLRMPLVAGEAPTPLQRAVAVADFGNGISNTLDFGTHLFVNTDLTVHLQREPVGEWVCVDARTDLDPAGIGQATSVLRDVHRRIGAAAQSLFVAER